MAIIMSSNKKVMSYSFILVSCFLNAYVCMVSCLLCVCVCVCVGVYVCVLVSVCVCVCERETFGTCMHVIYFASSHRPMQKIIVTDTFTLKRKRKKKSKDSQIT